MSHFFRADSFLSEVVVDVKFYGHLWFSLDSDEIHFLFSCEQFTIYHTSTTPILCQYCTINQSPNSILKFETISHYAMSLMSDILSDCLS